MEKRSNTDQTTDAANEAVARWLAALRSDAVLQGTNYLLQATNAAGDRAYCCLGIACELSGIGVWEPSEVTDDGHNASVYVTDADAVAANGLPNDVAALYGLRHRFGEFWPTLAWLARLERAYPATAARIIRQLPVATLMAGGEVPVTLASLNDAGVTFRELADVIESAPPGLYQAR